jgi:hypothetical protein
MMGAIANVTTTLASSVANSATFTVSYPSGVTRYDLINTTGGRMSVDDVLYAQGASGFTAVFGATTITITNTTGVTLPAGAAIILSFGDVPRRNVYTPSIGTGADQAARGDLAPSWVELTVSGAIPKGTRHVELNHISVVIAATLDVTGFIGLLSIKDTSASGTAAHTVTLTGGTFNGTNTIATLNARDEALYVYFDSAGRGNVVANIGAVALS